MFAITYNAGRNYACVSISGQLREDEWVTTRDMVVTASRQLDPGWSAAIDARGLKLLSPEDLDFHGRLLQAIRACQAGEVVILFDQALTKMQDTRIAKDAGTDSITKRFDSARDWAIYFDAVSTQRATTGAA